MSDEAAGQDGSYDPLHGIAPDRRRFLGLILAGSVVAVPLVTSIGLSGAMAVTATPNVSGATTTASGTTAVTTTSNGTTAEPTTTLEGTTTSSGTTTAEPTTTPPVTTTSDGTTTAEPDIG